jgi:ssDNA-binding Zn-finger/Zn-ribbon topoisomerase 1
MKIKCKECGEELELLVVYKDGTKFYWCNTCKKSHEEKLDKPS